MADEPIVYQNSNGGTMTVNPSSYQYLENNPSFKSVFEQMVNQQGFYRKGTGGKSGNAILDLAESMQVPLTQQTRDYLTEYYLNDKASEAAWNRSVGAAQHQYQWLVEDLKKAGLNAAQVLSGLNAASATSTAQGVSGGLMTSRSNKESENKTALLKTLFTAIASIVGLAIFKNKKY